MKTNMKNLVLLLSVLLVSTLGFSQEVEPSITSQSTSWATKSSLFGYPLEVGLTLLLIGMVMLVIIILLVTLISELGRMSYLDEKKRSGSASGIMKIFGIFEGDYTYLTSEYQDEVIHEYDGIQEYDNDLPPWWKAGFVATIIFAFVYLFLYHFSDNSFALLQGEEYAAEVAEAKIKYANVDQIYDGPIEDAIALESAHGIFTKSCLACHGAYGEGGVGPNLTDNYWLHGGDVNKVYSTIKYGVVEKGMKAWKSEYSNQEIYELSSYILSLKGSNPENAKEPQGELIE